MSRKRDARLTLGQTFFSSSIAGYVSKSATAPLDCLKIRCQVGTPETKNGISSAIRNIYLREGIRAFWKGNLLGCLRLCPYSAFQLIAFQRLRIPLSDSCGRLSPMSALVAGAGAGIIATVLMYPTDTVKTRLICQHGKIRWAHYKSITHAFKVISKEEGINALYKGMSTTFIGTVFYTTTMFVTYELMDNLDRKSDIFTTPAAGFFKGCVAAAVAQTASYPFDTIRKKMQAHSNFLDNKGGVDVAFTNVRQAFAATIHKYGFRGLWHGLTFNLLKVVPYTGLMFFMFESCKKFFLYQNGYTLSPFKEIPHPLVDQSLRPQQIEDEEDGGEWIISEED